MKMKILLFAAAGALLSGCVTLAIEATFEDLSLVREEPADIVAQYELPGRSAPVFPLTGMLRLDLAVDIDLYEVMEDKGFMLAREARTCESRVEIFGFSVIFENRTVAADAQGKLHHYSVFLHPS